MIRHFVGGRYRTRTLMSRHGSVATYAAEDLRSARAVAVALSSARDVATDAPLTHAVQVTAHLAHPYVLPVLDAGRDRDRDFVVFELPYDTLSEALKAGRFSAAKVRSLALELARALESLHALGVVHGALHPGAVGLDVSGSVRLALVPLAPAPPGWGGERAWVASEVLESGSCSAEGDIFGFGAILLSALVGSGPGAIDRHGTASLADWLRRTQEPELIALIAATLAGDPRVRPASMEAIAAALASSRAGRPALPARFAANANAIAPWWQRHHLELERAMGVAAAGAVLALALVRVVSPVPSLAAQSLVPAGVGCLATRTGARPAGCGDGVSSMRAATMRHHGTTGALVTTMRQRNASRGARFEVTGPLRAAPPAIAVESSPLEGALAEVPVVARVKAAPRVASSPGVASLRPVTRATWPRIPARPVGARMRRATPAPGRAHQAVLTKAVPGAPPGSPVRATTSTRSARPGLAPLRRALAHATAARASVARATASPALAPAGPARRRGTTIRRALGALHRVLRRQLAHLVAARRPSVPQALHARHAGWWGRGPRWRGAAGWRGTAARRPRGVGWVRVEERFAGSARSASPGGRVSACPVWSASSSARNACSPEGGPWGASAAGGRMAWSAPAMGSWRWSR